MQPTPIQIGWLALIVAILAVAQRLGGYENKPLARALVALSSLLFVWWIFYSLPLPLAGAIVALLVIGLGIWIKKHARYGIFGVVLGALALVVNLVWGITLLLNGNKPSIAKTPVADKASRSEPIVESVTPQTSVPGVSKKQVPVKRNVKRAVAKIAAPPPGLADKPAQIIQNAPGGINSIVTGGNPTINNTIVNPRPAPRRIPAEKQAEMIEILKRHHGSVRIMAIQHNDEAYQFAKDWFSLFVEADWEIIEKRVAVFWHIGEPAPGVLLKVHGETLAPGGVVEILRRSPEGAVSDCLYLLGMTSKDLRVQRYPELPEGQVILEISNRPEP